MSKKKQRNQKKKKEQIRNYDVLRVRMRRFFCDDYRLVFRSNDCSYSYYLLF